MEQSPEPRKRPGLDITSEIFVFEDPERIKKTLSRIVRGLFAGIPLHPHPVNHHDLGHHHQVWPSAVHVRLCHRHSVSTDADTPGKPVWRPWSPLVIVSLAGVVTGDGIHDATIIILPITIALGSLVLSSPLFYWFDRLDSGFHRDDRHPGIPGNHHQQVQRALGDRRTSSSCS